MPAPVCAYSVVKGGHWASAAAAGEWASVECCRAASSKDQCCVPAVRSKQLLE
jgi:hypothetical protein